MASLSSRTSEASVGIQRALPVASAGPRTVDDPLSRVPRTGSLRSPARDDSGVAAARPPASRAPSEAAEVPDRITIGEVDELRARGEEVVIVDARADRSYRADGITAQGAVRVDPTDAARSAKALGLSQHATLVIYCA